VKDAKKIFMINAANGKFETRNLDVTSVISQGPSFERDITGTSTGEREQN